MDNVATLGFSPLARHRRAETIASELRAMIVNNILPIGQKLPTEAMLCKQYDVSRTTLREAIQMLRSAGMLDVTPGRGSYVRAPNLGALIPTLQLASRGRSFDAETLHHLIHILALQSLNSTHNTSNRLRDVAPLLAECTLHREADAMNAAQLEGAWYLHLLNLSEHPLYGFLGQILIPLLCDARREMYQKEGTDGILKTMHLQLRVNAALAEGNILDAARYFETARAPMSQQAA